MEFPNSPREHIVSGVLHDDANPLLELRTARNHRIEARVDNHRPTFRERLHLALEARRETPIYELGVLFNKVGIGCGLVAVGSEFVVQNHDVATATGLLGAGLLSIGTIVASQA